MPFPKNPVPNTAFYWKRWVREEWPNNPENHVSLVEFKSLFSSKDDWGAYANHPVYLKFSASLAAKRLEYKRSVDRWKRMHPDKHVLMMQARIRNVERKKLKEENMLRHSRVTLGLI